MKKPSARRAAVQIAKRLVNPRHALQIFKRVRAGTHAPRTADDAQLSLYAEILSGDFLNYGFFDDPDIPPEQLSLSDIQQAQVRYGQLLIDQICDRASPVLDAGCGMGGLLNPLARQGFSPTALTPDASAIEYIRSRHPTVPLVRGKFEEIPREEYRHHFGTVITAESLQYINLIRALATLRQILKPGGRWVVCDYFRTHDSARKSGHRSGHRWSEFTRALQDGGWKIVSEQDITRNVLPTVGLIHMLGRRGALPLASFALAKLQRKHPAVHYLLEEVFDEIRKYLLDQLDLVNPEVFAREKKYVLLVVEEGA